MMSRNSADITSLESHKRSIAMPKNICVLKYKFMYIF